MRQLLAIGLLVFFGCGGSPAPIVESGFAEFGQSKLYYEVAGAGEPTVILLHGGMLDNTMWDEQFELLATSHRVIRYDASAHGQSALPPEAYWDHVDLRELMDHLQIDRAVLVGLSMGGRVAIDMALEEPSRVQAVVAVSSGLGGYRFESDFHMENRKKMIAAWKSGDFDAVVEAFQREWTDGPTRAPEDVDPKIRERVRRWPVPPSSRSWKVARYSRPPSIDSPSSTFRCWLWSVNSTCRGSTRSPTSWWRPTLRRNWSPSPASPTWSTSKRAEDASILVQFEADQARRDLHSGNGDRLLGPSPKRPEAKKRAPRKRGAKEDKKTERS